jgi:hypothetical protein
MRRKPEPRKPCQHYAALLRRQALEIGKLSGDFAPLGWEAPVIFLDLLQKQRGKRGRQGAEQTQMGKRHTPGFGRIPFQLQCIDSLFRKHTGYQ